MQLLMNAEKLVNLPKMKRIAMFLAAAMLLTSAVAQNSVDKQGRRQGHWVRTDKDGSKIYEGTFKDGLETGTFTYFYHDGTVRMRNTYTEPGTVCQHEAFDEQGHLLARGTYNRRNRDGRWQFYAEDGRLVKECDYKMGVKHGRHVVYTHNGDTAEVAGWQNNHRHGRWWKRIGKTGYITGTYVNGGLEGRLVEYDDAGLLIRDGHYKGGLKHGSYQYFDNNKLTIDETWHDGVMSDRKILLMTPNDEYVSIFDIVCLMPQGKAKVLVVFTDGSTKQAHESADVVYDRLGNDRFVFANRKSRVLVAQPHVHGTSTDADGRTILLLEPQPSFPIYPDEDGMKMVRSRQYEEDSPLDKLTGRK